MFTDSLSSSVVDDVIYSDLEVELYKLWFIALGYMNEFNLSFLYLLNVVYVLT